MSVLGVVVILTLAAAGLGAGYVLLRYSTTWITASVASIVTAIVVWLGVGAVTETGYGAMSAIPAFLLLVALPYTTFVLGGLIAFAIHARGRGI